MKNTKNNRKGFTIVELVIVIAVIAILATVLVPTFGNVIQDAKYSAAKQEAKNIYTEYISEIAKDGEYIDDCWVKTSDNYYVEIVDGGVTDADPSTSAPNAESYILISKSNGSVVTSAVATQGNGG